MAALQGPIHVLRGTGEQEKLLKNAKTEYQDEAEEIATYSAIETLAETVNDKETAKLATGPVPWGAPTHKDFIDLVTPQEFKNYPIDINSLMQWLMQHLAEKRAKGETKTSE